MHDIYHNTDKISRERGGKSRLGIVVLSWVSPYAKVAEVCLTCLKISAAQSTSPVDRNDTVKYVIS